MPDGEVWCPDCCPLCLLTDQDHERLRQFSYWRAELHWYGGGVGDMPCDYLAAMEVLSDEQSKIDAAEQAAKGEATK